MSVSQALADAAGGSENTLQPPHDAGLEGMKLPMLNLADGFDSIEALLDKVMPEGGNEPAATKSLRSQPPCAWRRVIVIAREQPGEKVLIGLAALFNYRWGLLSGSQSQQGSVNVLRQPSASRNYEERLWREYTKRAGKPLFDFANYAKISSEEWGRRRGALAGKPSEDARLSADNLKSLATPYLHVRLELLATLTEMQRHELISDETITVPGNTLTPRQWKLLRPPMTPGPHYDYFERVLTDEQAEKRMDLQMDFYSWAGITLQIERDPVTGAVFPSIRGFNISRSAAPGFLFPAHGNPYFFPNRKIPEPVGENKNEPFPETFKLPTASLGKPIVWFDIMKALGECFPKNAILLSDDFADLERLDVLTSTSLPSLSGMTLTQGLNTLCEVYGRLWWRDGDTFFFRSRTWFIQQRYDVPPETRVRLVQATAQIKKNNGKDSAASREILTTLGDLTREQLIGLSSQQFPDESGKVKSRTASPRPGQGVVEANNTYRYLQLFHMLNTDQQRRAMEGSGLPYKEMDDLQRKALLTFAANYIGIWIAERQEDINLTIEVNVYPARRISNYTKNEPGVSLLRVSFGFLKEASHTGLALRIPDPV